MAYVPKILVIDDEVGVGVFFQRLFQANFYEVSIAVSGSEAKNLWQTNHYQVALVDLKLPDVDGLTLLKNLKAVQPECEVIIMTGYATTRTAVKAMQLGAFDYVEKPFEDIQEIEKLVQMALEYSNRSMNANFQHPWAKVAERTGLFYGKNEEMHRALTIADKIAKKNINILIQGDTGTGKEVLAKFIHAASTRNQQRFLAVNCGAMPENLLESHLFGHEKGAFTGANNLHKGIFEMAGNGTLFLDEIGEASMSIQVKLLRVLESGEFYRVGGETPIRCNARLLAATNVDLEKAVADKKFRGDLFYRLDVVSLKVPSLFQRREDIPGMVQFFIKMLNTQDKEITVATEVMKRLCDYRWPGNVRELLNTLRQAMAFCDESIILLSHLPQKIIRADEQLAVIPISEETLEKEKINSWLLNLSRSVDNNCFSAEELVEFYQKAERTQKKIKEKLRQQGIRIDKPQPLDQAETKAIKRALFFYHGNITATAKTLGIGRNTLYRKLKEYNIQYDG